MLVIASLRSSVTSHDSKASPPNAKNTYQLCTVATSFDQRHLAFHSHIIRHNEANSTAEIWQWEEYTKKLEEQCGDRVITHKRLFMSHWNILILITLSVWIFCPRSPYFCSNVFTGVTTWWLLRPLKAVNHPFTLHTQCRKPVQKYVFNIFFFAKCTNEWSAWKC